MIIFQETEKKVNLCAYFRHLWIRRWLYGPLDLRMTMTVYGLKELVWGKLGAILLAFMDVSLLQLASLFLPTVTKDLYTCGIIMW